MPRKKSQASELGVQEKQQQPLVRRLNELITDPAALREYLSCSPQAINQYRLGTSSPTLEKLCKIAEFYNVSVDYLLGLTDIPNRDTTIQSVCEYTGLNEGAVNCIKFMTENGKSEVLNEVICNYDFFRVLGLIYRFSTSKSPHEEIFDISDKDRFPEISERDIYEALAISRASDLIRSVASNLKSAHSMEDKNNAVNEKKVD